jgi:hypothetical protein
MVSPVIIAVASIAGLVVAGLAYSSYYKKADPERSEYNSGQRGGKRSRCNSRRSRRK